jgi:hypothetical protein
MENDATVFLNYVNDHYKEVGGTLKLLSAQRKMKYSEDAFHESILRCHKAIEKKGFLKDKSPYGITSYLIRSYFNLINEEKRSAKNKKRDQNYNSDNIGGLHEQWYNSNFTDARQKVVSDLFKDFSVLYIMMVVEENFDNESFYLFKLKELIPDMTYKKLSEKTGLKGVRQKVVTVKKWVQQNISKEDIRKEFYLIYGDII